jgi:hypothetical protein
VPRGSHERRLGGPQARLSRRFPSGGDDLKGGTAMAKVYLDEMGGAHLTQRIKERVSSPIEQEKMVRVIKQMLEMEAPADALGHYRWYVNVGRIGRVVCRGNMVRTVLSFNEDFPGGTGYVLSGDKFVRA